MQLNSKSSIKKKKKTYNNNQAFTYKQHSELIEFAFFCYITQNQAV